TRFQNQPLGEGKSLVWFCFQLLPVKRKTRLEIESLGGWVDYDGTRTSGFRMTWAWLTLTSGVLNALWSSQIKSRVQKEGALTFTVSMRWGVALSLLPFALYAFKPLS